MFISAVDFDILVLGSMGVDSLLEPASTGHFKKLQFLALPRWLHFSASEDAAWGNMVSPLDACQEPGCGVLDPLQVGQG